MLLSHRTVDGDAIEMPWGELGSCLCILMVWGGVGPCQLHGLLLSSILAGFLAGGTKFLCRLLVHGLGSRQL